MQIKFLTLSALACLSTFTFAAPATPNVHEQKVKNVMQSPDVQNVFEYFINVVIDKVKKDSPNESITLTVHQAEDASPSTQHAQHAQHAEDAKDAKDAESATDSTQHAEDAKDAKDAENATDSTHHAEDAKDAESATDSTQHAEDAATSDEASKSIDTSDVTRPTDAPTTTPAP
ncbi:hypothetical protein G6F47_010395 [Rhizopus delemar]|nr:hypothetical protein G6F54_007270 [Rhizopus delemar]KAG1589280.1 hypothetical protein G6F47_010395 [Rhizopus delemar]